MYPRTLHDTTLFPAIPCLLFPTYKTLVLSNLFNRITRMHALLVNPWVYDFKAFDFWNKPLGLLIAGRILRDFGFDITLIDCMDRNSPYCVTETKTDPFGRGKYRFEVVEKPAIYRQVPRVYKRYGIPRDKFIDTINKIDNPDIILVSSTMTYWYPGVFEAIRMIKETFTSRTIILGGIYATLCEEHARIHSGADIVLNGMAEEKLPPLLRDLGFVRNTTKNREVLLPDFSLYRKLNYGVVLTSRGCPFRCTYCATKVLCPHFVSIPSEDVLSQISYFSTRTKNIAFFDDALLYNDNLKELLDEFIERRTGLQFHTSNGLHCRLLDEEFSKRMFLAGFRTMYLSLETTDPVVQQRTGGKVKTEEFINAVKMLRAVGFPPHALHAYILFGMPGQEEEEVAESINLCRQLSINPHLCEFSPIPHTEEYKKTGFDHNTDPLYHNNLFYTWYYPQPRPELYRKIKNQLTQGRQG